METVSSPIRIVIADHQNAVRESLKVIFDNQPGMEVVGECKDGLSAIELVLRENPDVALLGLQMPRMSGADAAIAILRQSPHSRILLLTAFDGEADILRAMEAGALGYLWKDSSRADFVRAIRKAAQGQIHLPSASLEVMR